MLTAVCLLSLLGAVLSAPETYVRWMELQPPQRVHNTPNVPKDFILSYKPYETTWQAFKLKHDKSYDTEEDAHRYQLFLDNVAYIESHNQLYQAGKKSFYLGLNHFGDYDFEEFKQLNGYRANNNNNASTGSQYLRSSFVTLPDSVDWRQKGYVTAVKNQGQCGSCWSFSATGSLEGQHFKLKGKLASLSEQQLVDCSTSFGNHGCSGGLMDDAFNYIKAVRGIDSEKSYPYLAMQEDQCEFKRRNIAATCTGFVDVTHGSESDLQQATATIGPISIAIDASHRSFQLYSGGVYDEPKCSSTQLDHGVLIVGYGVSDQGLDYWIVKNSWSAKWGLQGYVLMSRNKNNQCGVATQASYPLV